MSPSLRQMRAFVALAKTGSFTLAADYLHVTQSALSGLIKELESVLGLRVVERSTRKVQLSDLGRELYPLFEKMIEDLDGAMAGIAQRKALKTGLVRIAAPQMMSCTLLPEVIAAYREVYPEVQLRLVDCPVENVSGRVFSGEVDLGIGPERDATAEIAAQVLFEMPFVLVFPEQHPLQHKERVTWADLKDHPFISLQGQFTERLLRDVSLKPHNEVTFMTTALAMVSAGLGVTVCLPYAEAMVKLYRLQMRALHEPELTRRFFVYTKTGRSLSPAADSFIAFLFQFVETHEWNLSSVRLGAGTEQKLVSLL
ncbi:MULTISPECIES: LysR family transcriptional regulator [unclassified Janthinobacterium]|uniref:LysR family transcriptional regulator n=1 Tax=unclassified Janthinobacterium TaxID=2610881 RepID=UPI00161F1A12|nr:MULTISPECIES: LysR family transcriptional regulator [unclassified Janthinobacterium]MBB5367077.1 DNA-binding transcriptional LysR family regulator [Janthinobacterium sp. K2C7]MBB5380445.1 DNA-binding transcriptional LysR family regulator [Janthinobacterium sp. K2Li3]MBB5385459.1 DNA-binding transcriptional LysR family regulator [Janthinobacterium sp. K2E3]